MVAIIQQEVAKYLKEKSVPDAIVTLISEDLHVWKHLIVALVVTRGWKKCGLLIQGQQLIYLKSKFPTY